MLLAFFICIVLMLLLSGPDFSMSTREQPPKIINDLSSKQLVVVQEWEMVELVCNVTGVPKPTVNWYHISKGLNTNDDPQQDPDSPKKPIGVLGEVLLIHSASRYCAGEYECVAYNNVPPAASRKIRVIVEFPPEIRLPNRKIGQVKGKTTVLDCVVVAYPNATTVWRRNGQDIESNSKYRLEVYAEDKNTLTLALWIQSLTESDYGQYECMSENRLGKDSKTLILYEIVESTTTTATTTTRRQTTRQPHRHNNGRPNNKDNNDNNYNGKYTGKVVPYYTQRPPQHNSRLLGSERQPPVGPEGDNDNDSDNDGYNPYGSNNRQQQEGEGGPPYTYGYGPRNEHVIEPESRATTTTTSSWLLMLGLLSVASLALLR